jgi:large subunit ribosomal protein L21
MFAIIQCGGKQYKVAKDDVLRVEKIDAEAGKSVEIKEVVMIVDGSATTIGAPMVKGASVSAEIVAQEKAEKVIIFKKRRRQNYRRKRGHRQRLTVLKITGIKAA